MGTHQLRKLVELRAQNGERAAVGDRQRQVLCEYEHAGGQIGEDVFKARLCRLERRAVRLQHPPRFLELTGHRIDRLGETPSSSRLVTGAWREKSPRATACIACASVASGSARSFDCVAATAIATNSAMRSAKLSVTM